MIKPRIRKTESREDFIIRASKEYYVAGLHIMEIVDKLSAYEATTIEVYNAVVPTANVTTEDERETMISLYNQGYSIGRIARMMNRSRDCVRTRISSKPSMNIQTNSDNYLTESEVDEARRLYVDEGMGTTAIAKRFGVTRSSIVYRLRKMGVYEPWKNNTYAITKKDVAKMKRYAKKGLNYNQIAEKTGHCKETVSLYLRGLRKPII